MIKDQEFVLKLLRESKVIDMAQLDAARTAAIDIGSSDVIGELVKAGVVNNDELIAMLAQQYGMEVVSLEDFDIPEEVLEALRGDYARYYQVLPVSNDGSWLTVAMDDPTDVEKLDTLRYLLGSDVDAVIAPSDQILAALDKYYPETAEVSGSVNKDVDIDSAEWGICLHPEERHNGRPTASCEGCSRCKTGKQMLSDPRDT